MEQADLILASIIGVSGSFAAIFGALAYSLAIDREQSFKRAAFGADLDPEPFGLTPSQSLLWGIENAKHYPESESEAYESLTHSLTLVIWIVLGSVVLPLILLTRGVSDPNWVKFQVTSTVATFFYAAITISRLGLSAGRSLGNVLPESLATREELYRARLWANSSAPSEIDKLRELAIEVTERVININKQMLEGHEGQLAVTMKELRNFRLSLKAVGWILGIAALVAIWV